MGGERVFGPTYQRLAQSSRPAQWGPPEHKAECFDDEVLYIGVAKRPWSFLPVNKQTTSRITMVQTAAHELGRRVLVPLRNIIRGVVKSPETPPQWTKHRVSRTKRAKKNILGPLSKPERFQKLGFQSMSSIVIKNNQMSNSCQKREAAKTKKQTCTLSISA